MSEGVRVCLKTANKADKTRARIIKVTRDLVYRLGSDRVTLRNIAAACRMKAGSIYYHFRSKDEIVEAVLNDAMDRGCNAILEAVDKCGPGASAFVRLEAALRAHLHFVVDERLAARLATVYRLPAPIRDRHLAREREYGLLIGALMEEAANEGGIRQDVNLSVARMLGMGALTWTGEWYDPSGSLSLDDIADEFMRLFKEGLARSSPLTREL